MLGRQRPRQLAWLLLDSAAGWSDWRRHGFGFHSVVVASVGVEVVVAVLVAAFVSGTGLSENCMGLDRVSKWCRWPSADKAAVAGLEHSIRMQTRPHLPRPDRLQLGRRLVRSRWVILTS